MSRKPYCRQGICRAIYFGMATLWVSWSPATLYAEEGDLAKAILEETGIKKGVCLHVGLKDATLLSQLAEGSDLLLQGLSSDEKVVSEARRFLQAKDIYGRVSIDKGNVSAPFYSDHQAHLVIVDRLPQMLEQGLTLKETLRIVCPLGYAYLGCHVGEEGGLTVEALGQKLAEAEIKDFEISRRNGLWVRIKKPWPKEMGEWQYFDSPPSGNRVSTDVLIGVPNELAWLAGPTWPRGGRLSSTNAAVSANGRNFYVTNNTVENLTLGPAELRPYLVARDAFTGIFLWKRPWKGLFKTGWGNVDRIDGYQKKPNEDRRSPITPLAAVGDRFYTADEKQVVVLDAATGKVLKTFEEMDSLPDRVVKVGNDLLVLTQKSIYSFNEETGKCNWRNQTATTQIAVGDARIYFLDNQKTPPDLVCLDVATGSQTYRKSSEPWFPKETAKRTSGDREGSDKIAVHLRFYEDGVLVFGYDEGILAVSAADGNPLWSFKTPWMTRFPERGDAVYIGGLVWTYRDLRGYPDYPLGLYGLDIKTGNVIEHIPGGKPGLKTGAGGCTYVKGTPHFVMAGFVAMDLENKTLQRKTPARTACMIGSMPANGLVYGYPKGCACMEGEIRGFSAYRSAPETKAEKIEGVLEKGAAFGIRPSVEENLDVEWPCYRHDGQRSGALPSLVPAELSLLWQTAVVGPFSGALAEDWSTGHEFCDPVTSPVVAKDRVFVAARNQHRVDAYDVKDGRRLWSYTAGGPIDSPPTIYKDLCLFGCRDGWVYCLRASDGELVWRFRAAPREKRLVAFGQLESQWPVPGSVLVKDGIVYFSAGRSAKYTQEGLLLYAVEPFEGKVVWSNTMATVPNKAAHLNDILVTDGAVVFFKNMPLDPETGKTAGRQAPAGGRFLMNHHLSLLNGEWRRLPNSLRKTSHLWSYGPSKGVMLAFDKTEVFGYSVVANSDAAHGCADIRIRYSSVFKLPLEADDKAGVEPKKSGKIQRGDVLFGVPDPQWEMEVPVPMQMEAMALTEKFLFVAGPKDGLKPKDAELWVISRTDGKKLCSYPLEAAPVYDGMAAAGGRLYVATQDGKLLCLGKE